MRSVSLSRMLPVNVSIISLFLTIFTKEKEIYDKQIKQLEKFSKSLKKPKKCLSAYMIFVKETRPSIVK